MTRRIFTRILDSLSGDAFPRTRKWFWQRVYNILSLTWRDRDWRFMNYGFVPEGVPFPLMPDDEDERVFIGLYQQAVDGLPIQGLRVLEVGSGRGGGSRYVARYYKPAAMVGLDYSSQTVRLARRLNADTQALSFEIGDAEQLPFPDGSFDVVINIESSHCYANVPAFAREVSRVLVPGGWFTFADMRGKGSVAELERQLTAPGLELKAKRDISDRVVAALDAGEARKRARINKGKWMRGFMSEFAGSPGSQLYNGLVGGQVIYLAHRYRKLP